MEFKEKHSGLWFILYSSSLVSAGDWFQDLPQVPQSSDAQVPYIKWHRTAPSMCKYVFGYGKPTLSLLDCSAVGYNLATDTSIDKLFASGPTFFTFHGTEIKRHLLLGRKAMTNLDSILKSRDITLPTKVPIVKAVVFLVIMYGCENWTIKKAKQQRIDSFELWCWRRLLRVP